MAQVNVEEAGPELAALLDRAAGGEDIVIAKSGHPVARIVPLQRDLTPRTFGTMRGMFEVPDDFDDPLPPDVLAAFYGER